MIVMVKILIGKNRYKRKMIKNQTFFVNILSAKKFSLNRWLNSDENLKADGTLGFR